MPLNPMHSQEPINKELKLQIENALDAIKKNISKSITELTLLKKSAVIPPNP